MPLPNEALEALKRNLGPNGWLDSDEGAAYLEDIGGQGGRILLIARPDSAVQLGDVVRLCARHRVAIIPQGGNTNLCRMPVQTDGASFGEFANK